MKRPRADDDDDETTRRVVQGLARVSAALVVAARDGAREVGVSALQGRILEVLHARGGDVRLQGVVDALQVTPGTASEAVGALVEKGLVVRRTADDDARAVALSPTPAGRRAAARVASWPDALRGAVGQLDDDERATTWAALVKVIAALEREGRVPPARMCVTCAHFRSDAHQGASKPNHCALVDVPLGPVDVRIDCPEHAPALVPLGRRRRR